MTQWTHVQLKPFEIGCKMCSHLGVLMVGMHLPSQNNLNIIESGIINPITPATHKIISTVHYNARPFLNV
jgi:hypothetical protein